MATGSYNTVYGPTTNHWRAYEDISYNANDTTCVYTVKGGFASVGWGFNLANVSAVISCTGKASGNRSGNVQIGSGQTAKVQLGADATFTFQRTHSSQNIVISTKVTNATGYMNGVSTASFNTYVSPLPSYAVSYNANGGSGAPGNQTKWYGETLKLSNSSPTRTGYIFQGWSTSSTATSASYQPGTNYTSNAPLALYAVWKIAYVSPTISNLQAFRCDSAGNATDSGTYFKVTGSWKVDTSFSSTNTAQSVQVEYKTLSATAWTSAGVTSLTTVSGSLPTTVYGNNAISGTEGYDIRVTLTDTGGSASAQTQISPSFVTLDFKAGGKGVALGQSATDDGFTCGMDANFTKGFTTTKKLILTKDISYNPVWGTNLFSAGTPGTRGAQIVLESIDKSAQGYKLIAMLVTHISSSNAYSVLPFTYDGKLYVNLYRATNAALNHESANPVFTVRCVWVLESIAGTG